MVPALPCLPFTGLGEKFARPFAPAEKNEFYGETEPDGSFRQLFGQAGVGIFKNADRFVRGSGVSQGFCTGKEQSHWIVTDYEVRIANRRHLPKRPR